MKGIKIWLNDLSDKRHLKRLFGKYAILPYSFKEIYGEILVQSQATEDPKKLADLYRDLKYLKSAEKTILRMEAEKKETVAAIRKNISQL